MTSIEWLVDQLTNVDRPNYTNKRILAISKNSLQEKRIYELVEQAKEMEKQQIIDAVLFGMQKGLNINKVPETDGDWVNNYYTSIYGSKGSDEEFDVLKEMFELEGQLIDSYPISEDCEEVKNWDSFVHKKNQELTSSQTEISDEEYYKEVFYQKQVMNPYPSTKHLYTAWEKGFMECAKWYREQLKNIDQNIVK